VICNVPSSLQEAVANIVCGCTLYSPSSIPVPQGISEWGEGTPQIDIMKAKMCEQVQTLSPSFFSVGINPVVCHQKKYFSHSGDYVDNYSVC
jgi:hypothetical protein